MLTETTLPTATAEYLIFQQSSAPHHQHGTIPLGGQQAIQWQVGCAGLLLSLTGLSFALSEIHPHSRYGFAFPIYVSAKTAIYAYAQCLPHHHSTLPHRCPHSTASDQVTHITANKVQQRVQACEIHWSYPVPHHPEQLLYKITEGSLEDQLHQLRPCPPGGCACSNSASSI